MSRESWYNFVTIVKLASSNDLFAKLFSFNKKFYLRKYSQCSHNEPGSARPCDITVEGSKLLLNYSGQSLTDLFNSAEDFLSRSFSNIQAVLIVTNQLRFLPPVSVHIKKILAGGVV